MDGCINHTTTGADLHLMSVLVPTDMLDGRLKTEVGHRLTTEENDQTII